MPGVFKNAIDWLSRPPKDSPRIFRDRAGRGGRRFAGRLRHAARAERLAAGVAHARARGHGSAHGWRCRGPAAYSMPTAICRTRRSANRSRHSSPEFAKFIAGAPIGKYNELRHAACCSARAENAARATAARSVQAKRAARAPVPGDVEWKKLRRVLAFVLAGGEGRRLAPLTRHVAKPAVPFHTSHRLIDFALSNLRNSGIRAIHVLMQYQPQSVLQHLMAYWRCRPAGSGRASSTRSSGGVGGMPAFAGTADAVYQQPPADHRLLPGRGRDLQRRPYLSDGRAPDDRLPPGVRRRRDGVGVAGSAGGRPARSA